jgi:hypothetical protein
MDPMPSAGKFDDLPLDRPVVIGEIRRPTHCRRYQRHRAPRQSESGPGRLADRGGLGPAGQAQARRAIRNSGTFVPFRRVEPRAVLKMADVDEIGVIVGCNRAEKLGALIDVEPAS